MTWALFIFVSGIKTELQARAKILADFDYICFWFVDLCVEGIAAFLLCCRTTRR